MAKITKEMKKDLAKSFARLKHDDIAELFIFTANKQSKDMIKDFQKGMSIEELEKKWITD